MNTTNISSPGYHHPDLSLVVCLAKTEVFAVAHEGDDVARSPAAEAVVALASRVDGE